ncbi:MAG: Nif3-like dinuclear metal center hexameric protein [Eubacterium sp.]|nr:Nif3-like dinuclear metal center hexameric protein [Eubacterium sp.]
MKELKDIINCIEARFPLSLAEEWDNSGIQVDTGRPVSRILVALEATDEVVDEAIERGADLIVTHHPLLFSPVSSIDWREPVMERLMGLIRAGISVYSTHTPFDIGQGGMNDLIGFRFGMREIAPMDGGDPYCRKGLLREPISVLELARLAAERLKVPAEGIRIIGDPDRVVTEAAWCGGAGADFMENAVRAGFEVFMTGDVKYHQARRAEELGLCVIDAGHFGTEKLFTAAMADLLRTSLQEDVEVLQAESLEDPFRYLNTNE